MPKRKDIEKVLVIGSGPIVIGQAAEFDYAGTQACMALKAEGIHVVLVNNNPATMMTDEQFADTVYFEPLTVASLTAIIEKERPDGILGTLGGQTGLNLTVELYKNKILQKYNVEMLGTSAESIIKGEDREAFRSLMEELHEPVAESEIVTTVEEAIQFANEVGYPVIIRPAYTLGGAGGGIVDDEDQLKTVIQRGLDASPISQCLIEKSIAGFKEMEFEMMRDENDTCISICSMENFDPVGVHTGDSIVIAPQQTLADDEFEMLYHSAVKIIRALGIVGGCNIQYALHPNKKQYYVIEVNPRVSRSSALASKATGYPIAKIATKLSLGYHLHEIVNPVTGHTFASFEPVLDYIVVKFPRWPFDKFTDADKTLGTQMKATGEVMAMDRTLTGAFQKAVRSLELKTNGLGLTKLNDVSKENLLHSIKTANDERFFAIIELYRRGMTPEEIHGYTNISLYFLDSLFSLIQLEEKVKETSIDSVSDELLQTLKEHQFADEWLASVWKTSFTQVRQHYKKRNIKPHYYMVDTCAGQFPAKTPYFYSSWYGEGELPTLKKQHKKIVVIGSGPIRIGQGIEFDYCSVHSVLALKKAGYETILINNNPETVSTDFEIADRLYFEPLTLEDVLNVIEHEQPDGVIIQYGGQTAINLAKGLEEHGVPLLGTSQEIVDLFEDRERFYQFLQKLDIPHIPGETALNKEDLQQKCQQIGFPVLIRPSYVIGGQGMFISEHEHDLMKRIEKIQYPVLIDAYYRGKEVEVDAISDGKQVVIPAMFEHVEKAGVHSGDSMAITPPITLSNDIKEKVKQYTEKIAQAISFKGIFNIQFVIYEGVVYVLEVNPRASRTIPIASKISGIDMIEESTLALLGNDLTCKQNDEPSFFTLKSPIFSGGKLPNVDPKLSPEMKSTGEIIAIGSTIEEIGRKVIVWDDKHKEKLANNHIEIYVDSCEEQQEVITRIEQEGFIPITDLSDDELDEWFKKKEATMFISFANTNQAIRRRKEALKRQLYVISDIDTLRMFFIGMTDQTSHLLSIQEWRKNAKVELTK